MRSQKILSIGLAIAAMLWGAWVVRQSMQTDDGGPPMGALCAGVPAFLLLLAAGSVWPRSRKQE